MRRAALGAGLLLPALLLQGVLPLRPELLLAVVVAVGLAQGSAAGAGTGFLAGLLVDLGADHELGRVALAYAVAGHVAGLVEQRERSRLLPLVVAAGAAASAVVVFAVEGALLGDPRTTLATLGPALAATVVRCVLPAVVVVPVVGALVRRLQA